jgi:hypothetical protein
MEKPFYFYTRLNLVELLGRQAKNLDQLLEGLRQVPDSSIYYHTHRFLQQHHYLSPEPPNDFAFWVTNSLGLDKPGEKLASVDTVRFRSIKGLREKFLEILEPLVLVQNYRSVECQGGEEFHFMSCRTFIFPTPYQARDLGEFLDVLRKVSINSIYFHIFEARLRLEREDNDFSFWFEGIGHKELAAEISRLDPYTITLEGLRKKIIQQVGRYVEN